MSAMRPRQARRTTRLVARGCGPAESIRPRRECEDYSGAGRAARAGPRAGGRPDLVRRFTGRHGAATARRHSAIASTSRIAPDDVPPKRATVRRSTAGQRLSALGGQRQVDIVRHVGGAAESRGITTRNVSPTAAVTPATRDASGPHEKVEKMYRDSPSAPWPRQSRVPHDLRPVSRSAMARTTSASSTRLMFKCWKLLQRWDVGRDGEHRASSGRRDDTPNQTPADSATYRPPQGLGERS